MAESYSVQAILSANDKNFSAGMKSASSALSSLKTSITGGLGFGILAGIGQQAFSAISGSVTGLVGEISSSNAAWKTFSANMEMAGKGKDEIASIKGELQSFAEQTIYSASDMASTYSQLAAVGTKNTTQLVKGFGGLAAASENPKQAMKTLSQQATQMAAKPKVAWEDFKLMLEQTPAGISQIAKSMGMTTAELVKNVQDGKVKTEDFFDAISKVGTNDAFTKLATQYKTVGQAMDGLQETVSNKLAPAFDVLSNVGINAVSSIVDAVGSIDASGLADKLTAGLDSASKYWDVFKTDVSEVGKAFGSAVSAVMQSLGELNGSFGSTDSIKSFSSVMDVATGALTTFAGFLEEHADAVAKVISLLPKLFLAYQGFKIVRTVAPFVGSFSGAILKLTAGGVGKIAGKLFGIAAGETATGNASKKSATQMLKAAKAFALMGVAVLTISAGFALLAYSAISVANAGPAAIAVLFGLIAAVAALGAGMAVMLNSIKASPAKLTAISTAMVALGAAVVLAAAGFAILTASAINLASAGPLAIAVMVGMVAAIAGLAVGAAALAPALTAGAVGFVAFGAGIALVGVSALAAAAALAVVASVLPVVVEYGTSGAVAIAALSASMIVFAAGAALAGAGALVLGAGLLVAGAGALVAAVGVLALSAAVLVLSAGILLAAAGVALLGAALPAVGVGAITAATGLTALSAAALVCTAGLVAFDDAAVVSTVGVAAFGAAMLVAAGGSVAMAAALVGVNTSMASISSNAKSAQTSISAMQGSISVVQSGLNGLESIAQSAVNKLISAFDNGARRAKSSGQKIGTNTQNGVKSGTNQLPTIATQAMSRFNAAIGSGGARAVATSRNMARSIVSSMNGASGGAYSAGRNIGVGLANGMESQLGRVRSVAAQLAAAAEAAIRAEAKIHSPSRVTQELGEYFGDGWADGIQSRIADAHHAAAELVSVPSLASMPTISNYGNATLNDVYEYRSNETYTIIVPLDLDGREVAKATVTYTKSELETQQRREERRKGRR